MLVSNRVTNILLVIMIAVGIGIVAMLASRARGGPLDPPGPPASTLPQVEPRIPISQPASPAGFPITISQSGSYFLTGNITAPAGKGGIVIAAAMVTLDLNGFTLAGQGQPGIADDGTVARANIVIRNGNITGWNPGVFGTFFVRSTFEDLRVTGAAFDGLDIGSGNTVRRVTATENGASGVVIYQRGSYYAGTVTDSNLNGNQGAGLDIEANNITVRHNVLDGNNYGVAIHSGLNWLEDNDITGNISFGVYIFGGKNTVVGNFITQNPVPQVKDTGIGNVVGTLTTTEAGSDSWSNISYP